MNGVEMRAMLARLAKATNPNPSERSLRRWGIGWREVGWCSVCV